jgi:hypothetical protein
VQEPESIVVLAVKVQKPCRTVGVSIGNFQVLRKSDSVRERGIDVSGDALSGVHMQRGPACNIHADREGTFWQSSQRVSNAIDNLAERRDVFRSRV